ncbi:hypothetical protein PR048_019201 [Dryococelus australis]|uniref:Uncharacterized protein n=1 Tax=Dryococelus australis TaxID=614101 RepID=A0ABQ9H2X0_9NEOP|nr:hypothetical protein PR048_019201 [Dryococelus australis]
MLRSDRRSLVGGRGEQLQSHDVSTSEHPVQLHSTPFPAPDCRSLPCIAKLCTCSTAHVSYNPSPPPNHPPNSSDKSPPGIVERVHFPQSPEFTDGRWRNSRKSCAGPKGRAEFPFCPVTKASLQTAVLQFYDWPARLARTQFCALPSRHVTSYSIPVPTTFHTSSLSEESNSQLTSNWEPCRTMPLVGGFSRGSPVFPRPQHSDATPCSSRFTSIGSQYPVVMSGMGPRENPAYKWVEWATRGLWSGGERRLPSPGAPPWCEAWVRSPRRSRSRVTPFCKVTPPTGSPPGRSPPPDPPDGGRASEILIFPFWVIVFSVYLSALCYSSCRPPELKAVHDKTFPSVTNSIITPNQTRPMSRLVARDKRNLNDGHREVHGIFLLSLRAPSAGRVSELRSDYSPYGVAGGARRSHLSSSPFDVGILSAQRSTRRPRFSPLPTSQEARSDKGDKTKRSKCPIAPMRKACSVPVVQRLPMELFGSIYTFCRNSSFSRHNIALVIWVALDNEVLTQDEGEMT